MKFDNKCGKENNQDSKFCNSCGSKFNNASIESTSEPSKKKNSTLKQNLITIGIIVAVGLIVGIYYVYSASNFKEGSISKEYIFHKENENEKWIFEELTRHLQSR